MENEQIQKEINNSKMLHNNLARQKDIIHKTYSKEDKIYLSKLDNKIRLYRQKKQFEMVRYFQKLRAWIIYDNSRTPK
jgi:hypothetical protein